ncbi:hypothetical protein L2E82_22597 [Cichorium intybus]|uniref:Uncharacterized protein n=1 Tax=Cichorium intybus TaxID=13427 RepID=A0ACB9DXN4_CICIN|nr:hypothetical protein L2E82_22597 [Cichorium intybus]
MTPVRPSGYVSDAAFGLCLRCGLRAMIFSAAFSAMILLQIRLLTELYSSRYLLLSLQLCLGSVTLMSCLNISSTIIDEILELAIVDSKAVLDIEHLEDSLPRIYGTIFPMNLKPMTTSKSEAIVLMNWLAMNYATMNCRNKNSMVLKTEMKRMKIHGK